MNYCGLNLCDCANGPGVRVSLFVSGCTLHCKGCFNQASWDFAYGKPYTCNTEKQILDTVAQDYCSGISVLGGDPVEQANLEQVTALCSKVKALGKTVWLWTGRKYEHVKDLELFKYVDVVIDGPFVESKKVEHKLFGSANQRIIRIGEIK